MRVDSIKVAKVEKVQLVDRFNAKQSTLGTLYITSTHLIFVVDENGKETWILNSHILSADRGQITAAGCPLTIACKTFLSVSFLMSRDKECQDVYETVNEICQPMNLEDVYAFSYVPSCKEIGQSDGWTSINTLEDYARLGVPNDAWVVTDFNDNYAHCDTYPQKLFVPKSAPTQVLIGSSKFRSRGRLPVLCYLYPANQASICRCSQPLTGFSARCMEDETLLEHILRTNKRSNVLYVIDTRPKVNALANKAAGKGFENEAHYNNMKFYFFGIENIHAMRASLQKLLEVSCQRNSTLTSFLSGLEGSAWLRHIRAILEAGNFLADSILKGINCVVHCSDGWDRTPQTISTACIILDPFYRTIKGFQTLIEKDWLSFGHKFSERCGHTRQTDNKETSPIFTQFLECVWNMMQQYPQAFEFNERYLLILHDNVYSCQFGTFLGNCDKDRVDLRLAKRTYSFWAYVDRQTEEFLNPIYNSQISPAVLKIDMRPQFMKFWMSMYNRFDAGVHPRENLQDLTTAMRDHVDALEYTASILNKKILDLKMALGKNIKSPTSPHPMQDSGHFTTESGDSFTTPGLGSSSTESEYINYDTSAQLTHLKIQSDCESGIEDLSTPGAAATKRSAYSNNTLDGRFSCQSVTSPTADGPGFIPCTVGAQARWESVRRAKECPSCANHFQSWQRKYHCWQCGKICCRRCVECKTTELGSADLGTGVVGLPKPTVCRLCRQQLGAKDQHEPV